MTKADFERQAEQVAAILENQRLAAISQAEDMGLVFEDNQGKTHYLSGALAKRQKITPEQITELKRLHIEMADTKHLMKEVKDPATLKNLVQMVEDLEFEMQDNWNFDRDAAFHTHWLDCPGCTCPKMDNRDPMYHGRRITVGGCPLHG